LFHSHRRRAAAAFRALAVEFLEDRRLLAADLVYQATESVALTLRLSEGTVQIVDTSQLTTVLASTPLNEITAGVRIDGNAFDVSLTIDASMPPVIGGILFAGGTGSSTLTGPDADTDWILDGLGSGVFDGVNTFTGVESLIGGAGNDTFAFSGNFGGTIDGGGGTNTLDYSACRTPVLADLAAGVAKVGGFIRSGTMVGLTADMPVRYLNYGAGVGQASLAMDTPLGGLNGGAGVGTALLSLTRGTLLASLNNGLGVAGELRITLTDWSSAVVDLADAQTVGDVLDAIEAADSRLTAAINAAGNGIDLSDSAGGDEYLTVDDLNGSTAATDLGLTGNSTGSRLYGQPLVNDLRITLGDGSTVKVSLGGAETIADAIEAINGADSRIYAQLNDAGDGIDLSDSTIGSGNLTVADLPGSTAATDLGLAGTGTGDVLRGRSLVDDLRITLRDGSTVEVNLGNPATVAEVLAAIQAAAPARLTAVIHPAGNGILLDDSGSGTGNLAVASLNGCTAAADLGLAGSGTGGVLQGTAIVGAIVTASISNVQHAIGGAGDDLLIGTSGDNQLTGGEGADTFQFADGWGADTITDYGIEGVDTLDFSAVTADLTVTIQADGAVSITDVTSTLDDVEGIDKISGGRGDNVFAFEDGAAFAGTLDGGTGGTNKLDYASFTTAVSVDLAAGTAVASGITTTIARFGAVTGGLGNDTLTGTDGVDHLEGGAGDDLLAGGAGDDQLAGGAGDDTYMITDGSGTETITEEPDAGTDTLDYSAWTTGMVWNVAGGSPPGVNSAENIERIVLGGGDDVLTGSSLDDVFLFRDGWGADGVTDSTDTDRDILDFSSVHESLTFEFACEAGTCGFSVVSEGGVNQVLATGVENVAGGKADDRFVFHDGWGDVVITNAGTLDEDVLDFSAVAADLTFTIYDDGRVSATDGTNTLGASGGIEGIRGGLGNNTFVFQDDGYVDGWIEGGTGAGKTNTLDYSAYQSAIIVDLGKMDVVETGFVNGELTTNVNIGRATGTTGINGIHAILGGLSVDDTLVGPMRHNTWTMTAENSGTVNSIDFSGFENLTGTADHDDAFLLEGGCVTGTLSGSGWDRASGTDTIDIQTGSFTNVVYRAYSNVGTTAVNLTGDATDLENWKVALTDAAGTTTYYAYAVAGTGATRNDVANGLAAQINADSPANYAASAEGDTLVITNVSGEDFETSLQVVPTAAVSSPAATATVTLFGEARDTEQWEVTLTAGGTTTTHSYVVSGTQVTLHDVALGLAEDINADAADGFVASVVGDTLVIANTMQVFTMTATVPLGGATSMDTTTATAKMIRLTGTAAESEEWSLGLTRDGQTTYHRYYVAKAGATLDDVAAGLVSALNENTTAQFVAGARGDTLVLTNVTGAAFDVSLSITPVKAIQATIDHDAGQIGRDDAWFRYSGIETITDSSAATHRTWTGTNRDDAVRLSQEGAAAVKIESDNGRFLPFSLAEPTGTLTLRGDAGDDTVTFGDLGLTAALAIAGGAGHDRVFFELQAEANATSLDVAAGTASLDAGTLFTYSDVESPENLIVQATDGPDQIVLAPAAAGYYSVSANTFGTITFNDPGTAGSLTILAAAGDDTIDSSTIVDFVPALTLDGGDGSDSLTLGSGHYHTLSYGTANESVDGLFTVDNFVFKPRASIDNRVHIWRPVAGQIALDEQSGVLPGVKTTTIRDPLVSLNVSTGFNAQGTTEHIHVGQKFDGTLSALGTLNADLTLDGGSLHSDDGPDSIVIYGDLALNGNDLRMKAETITIADGVTVSTSEATGQAGSITLDGHTITIGAGAKLLAEGASIETSGDIAISAVDDTSIWTPGLDIDISEVDVVLSSDAQLKGRDVTILATADNRQVSGATGVAGDLANIAGNVLEGLLTFEATLAWEQVDSKIDLQTGSTIAARDFTAYARSYGKIQAAPLASIIGGFGVGIILSDATVDVAGTVTTAGDLTVRATTDHWLDVVNDNTAVKRIAVGFALGIIVSDTNARVTDDAVLDVGGSLYILADTIDRTRVMSRSPSGNDGSLAIAAAISVEDGDTNAWLDGTATVAGDVEVSATAVQDMVPVKKLFVMPSVTIGTMAQAGTGSNSKGDLLDETKSSLTSPVSGFISEVLLPKLQAKITKGPPDTSIPKDDSAFDAAGGISVVVDTNRTVARIGDSNADGDDRSGEVDAGGDVAVHSSIASSPWISASASAAANPDTASVTSPSKISGAVALSVGICKNDAQAYVGSAATVDAAGALSVNAETLSDFSFAWLKNLVDPWLETATYTTEDAEQDVKVYAGDTVEIGDNHTGGGDVGTWYEYLGTTPKDIALASEDFSDETLWAAINPAARKRDAFLTILPSYLSGDFGFSNWIANSMSIATANGAELAVAGAITFLNLRQNAEAVIRSGASINQQSPASVDQAVSVVATNHNEAVNLGGNVALPSLQVAADKSGIIKPKIPFTSLQIPIPFKTIGKPIDPWSWNNTKKWWKDAFAKPGAGTGAEEKGAVGVTLLGFHFDDTTTAKIEDEARVRADSLCVNAETNVLSVDIGASGGQAGNVGFNGALVLNVVRNKTLAQIAGGAIIDVGSGLVFDPDQTDPAENGSVVVKASDDSFVIGLEGGVAVSDHVGIGGAVGVSVILRDTQAVVGDLEGDAPSEVKGSLTAGGNVLVGAHNGGFLGNFAVSGSYADGSAKPQTQAEPQSPDQSFLSGLLGAAKSLLSKKDQSDSTGGIPSNVTGYSMPKSGIAVSGSATVQVIDDDARAYVLDSGPIVVSGGGLVVEARNSTSHGALAGAVAFGKSSSYMKSAGIAGAFGVNILTGDTKAFVDGAASLDLNALEIEAIRSGWTVSLTAGFGLARGDKAVGVGGSVSVDVTMYTVESLLQNTAGVVHGPVTLDASDDTNRITIGGAGGFGAKAGFGIAFAFSYSENDVRAEMSQVTDLKHAGDLDVRATADGLIVSVTGSIGIATGSRYVQGGYAAAGTVSVNYVHNTVEANILDSRTTGDSAGNITVHAEDRSSIYSFAGALAIGKERGIGAAIAVNVLDNAVRSAVEGSTLTTIVGSFTQTAQETGTVVSLAVAGAGSKKLAIGASVGINLFVNTIDAHVADSTVQASAALTLQADDREISVALGGGLAVSTEQAAAGAAVGINLIFDSVTAGVDGSTLASTGSTVIISADAEEVLVGVTLGGALGKQFALGGSVSVSVVVNTVEAAVTGASTITAAGDVGVTADDQITVVVVAGGFAGSKTAAVGIAASTVYEQNAIHALVDGSTVTSTAGKVTVAAGIAPPDTAADLADISLGTSGIVLPETNSSQIINLTVGGAGSSGAMAAGVSLSVNVINNTIAAEIVRGSRVDAQGDVTASAIDASSIEALSVGAAGANEVAVGGGAAANAITNTLSPGSTGPPFLRMPT